MSKKSATPPSPDTPPEKSQEAERALEILKKMTATKEGKQAIEAALSDSVAPIKQESREKLLKQFAYRIKANAGMVENLACQLACDLIAQGASLAEICEAGNIGYVTLAQGLGRFAPIRYAASVEIRDQVRRDIVIAQLFDTCTATMSDVVNDDGTVKKMSQIPKRAKKAVEAYEVTDRGTKVKLAPKIPSLKLLGSHLGLFDTASAKDQGNVSLESIFQKLENIEESTSIPKVVPVTYEVKKKE